MQRIKRDARHRGIIMMKTSVIQGRRFSEWTMAFRKLDSEDLQEMDGYSPFMELSFESEAFQEEPDFGYRMLLQFKEKMH